MKWLTVDEDGTELQHFKKPTQKLFNALVGGFWSRCPEKYCYLPLGTIKELIGRKLTWTDEPIKLKTKNN